MGIPITGLFEPSGGAGAFDLYSPADIEAGNVNVILQAIASGAFKGGSHATSPVGEVVIQVKTTTGAPNHSASLGTPCWNSIDLLLYVNNNGSTGWTLTGPGGSPGAHQLAVSGGPHTGTLPWGDLSKTGSSLADLATRTHANLSDAPADAHHNHLTIGADAAHSLATQVLSAVLAGAAQVGHVGTGAQTWAGVKTFSSIPVLPDSDPSADNEAVRKLYVDDHAVANNKIFNAKGDIIGGTGANASARLPVSTNGKILVPDSGETTGLKWKWDEATIEYVIDGGGEAITTGLAGGLEIPYHCFVTGWTIVATDGNTGAIVVDVWMDSYANFPPTVADTIAGSEKPTITATGNKGQDLTLSTWTQALTKGNWLFFKVDSVTTLERVTVSLRVDKYRTS